MRQTSLLSYFFKIATAIQVFIDHHSDQPAAIDIEANPLDNGQHILTIKSFLIKVATYLDKMLL